MYFQSQQPYAQNAGTRKHISGQVKQEAQMNQKPDSSDAKSASIRGENIADTKFVLSNQRYLSREYR